MVVIGEEKIKPISFRKLMQVKQVDTDVYESIASAWLPTMPPGTKQLTYGGHVYAQSAWAASKTVKRGFVIHNMTGHWLLPGAPGVPFRYHVTRLRDGGIYSLRQVRAYQASPVANSGKTPCFVATISLKRDEPHVTTVEYAHQDQPRDHLAREYQAVLQGKGPDDFPHAPGADAAWYDERFRGRVDQAAQAAPGIDIRSVDMGPYNAVAAAAAVTRDPAKYRQLMFYRMRKEGPGDLDEMDLNLHACAHLYASDRNSVYIMQRAQGYEEEMARMASLAHTAVFVGGGEGLRMVDERDNDKWFVCEVWSSGSGDNRVVHNTRLLDYNEGRVVGTTMQDGMLRVVAKEGDSKL